MGDLNYRLDYSHCADLKDKPWEEVCVVCVSHSSVAVYICTYIPVSPHINQPPRHPHNTKPHKQQRATVLAMIEAQDWKGLYALDELQRELKAGNVLSGFATPDCDFAPTFKV
jgi:hypothetical protein